jgi:hypothetical protein
MGHHKRGRPKNARAGCGLCKPHKRSHAKDPLKASVKRVIDNREHDRGPEAG